MSTVTVTGTIAGAAVALTLAGCGTSSESAKTTRDATRTCAPLSDAATTARSRPGGPEPMYLRHVSVETDGCVDRVTFAFAPAGVGREPGFRVGYAPPSAALIEDGSGRRVPVAGKAYLVVRLEPAATAKASGEGLEFTYDGPKRLALPGAHRVREVVKTGDFEAVVRWTIGLDRERPFRVVPSASPPGLTVEVG